jgi:hypothetical protein
VLSVTEEEKKKREEKEKKRGRSSIRLKRRLFSKACG